MRGYSDYSQKDARPEGQTAAEIKRESIEAEVAAEVHEPTVQRVADAINQRATEIINQAAAHQIDIRFTDHGSLAVAVGVSVKGEEWLAAHLDPNGQRWGKNGYVIEPPYVQDIVYGAQDDGLDVA